VCFVENAIYYYLWYHDPSALVLLNSPVIGKQAGIAVVDIGVVFERNIGERTGSHSSIKPGL
jgi:hypothetical protein